MKYQVADLNNGPFGDVYDSEEAADTMRERCIAEGIEADMRHGEISREEAEREARLFFHVIEIEEPQSGRDLLECRRLDPNYRLAAPGAAEYFDDQFLTEDQVDRLNDAIEAWAQRDPMGYSEHEAQRLEREIAKILEDQP